MKNLPFYDIARWQVHETEDDCDLIIQTNNRQAFYCTVFPSNFQRSLQLTDQWTKSYRPSDVEILYNRSEDVLIKRLHRVHVDSVVKCHFKPFGLSFGAARAKKELVTLKICCLHRVVYDRDRLIGILSIWINTKGVLLKARAEQNPPDLRKRWKTQINTSLEKLHQKGITWGDVEDENVLIDRDDNAWIIDFGGSYTCRWVDKEKAGTLAGDAQGLAKILDILQ
ncbi:uncharacterized protein LY79DRAFT_516879 [Colletotrichum navitas]|uniref:Protein kinase domain-containing protein n=1 Tax=Colletotrichum navitas TaxID=681940 RepID=A0AAD8V543_9PEZI|nr:uncharacterized protein LY79DRAFT_516879 [Colletotrichum navitas]KAK1589863.1 hypothetical protein LY79DRAFT_516879 [Colletotrichum navitas]